MDPNQTVDASASPAPVSLDEMVASLATDGAEASADGHEPAPAAEEAAPEAVEPDQDEGEEAEAAPKGAAEATKTDTKKTSRNQRLKAARDAALADVVTEKKNAAQAVSVANYWRTEAQARDTLLRHVLKETGFQLDQRDLALLDVRRENVRKEFEAQTAKTVEQIDREHAATVERRALADDYSSQAHALSAKTGVPPVQILRSFALAESQGFGLTMEQVAQQLRSLKGQGGSTAPAPQRSAAQNQLAANRSAPRPVRGGRVPAPAFDTSLDGMLSFLESKPSAR